MHKYILNVIPGLTLGFALYEKDGTQHARVAREGNRTIWTEGCYLNNAQIDCIHEWVVMCVVEEAEGKNWNANIITALSAYVTLGFESTVKDLLLKKQKI